MIHGIFLYLIVTLSSPLCAIEAVLDGMKLESIVPSSQRIIEKIEFEPQAATFTKALYRITNTRTHQTYILKELQDTSILGGMTGQIVERLEGVTQHFKDYETFGNAPTIIPIIAAYKMQKDEHQVNYFILMPEAAGKALNQWMESFLEVEPTDPSQVDHVFHSLGSSLAMWHIAGARWLDQPADLAIFRTRYVHGDLHGDNIFYDGQKFYFIDNDLISRSLDKPKGIKNDIARVTLATIRMMDLFDKDEVVPTKRATITCALTSFLKGYISRFPAAANAKDYLLKLLKELVSNEDLDNDEIERKLPEVKRQEMIESIFAALA